MPFIPAKRVAEAANTSFERAKRNRKPTLKAREGDGTQQPQPICLVTPPPTKPPNPATPPPTQPTGPPTPVQYWISYERKYPSLSRFAIDMMTIPASSCECERAFSQLGDLLEPKRRKIGSQLLVALQCVKAWHQAGFLFPVDAGFDAKMGNESSQQIYDIQNWWPNE